MRPAAHATRSVLKRPAAYKTCFDDGDDVLLDPRWTDKVAAQDGCSRGAFTTRAYKCAMRRTGENKTIAKACYKIASKTWAEANAK